MYCDKNGQFTSTFVFKNENKLQAASSGESSIERLHITFFTQHM